MLRKNTKKLSKKLNLKFFSHKSGLNPKQSGQNSKQSGQNLVKSVKNSKKIVLYQGFHTITGDCTKGIRTKRGPPVSTLYHVTFRGLSTDTPPLLLVHVVIEWPPTQHTKD